MKKLRIAAYTLELPEYACAQLRVLQPALLLADRISLGWCTQARGNDYAVSAAGLESADLVLFQRTFPQQHTWSLILQALGSGKPVVYDLDDNFFAMPEAHPMARRITNECAPFVRKLIKRAHLVTVSTPALGEALQAQTATRIEVLPNFLPERLWQTAMPPSLAPGAPVYVGFAGSATHGQDLALVEEALVHTAERFGERVRILLYGCQTPALARLPQARVIPFAHAYAAFAGALPAQGLHIGLAPLQDNAFNRCKSDIKWQEYAACGICGIYSDTRPYAGRVRPGETGLLAGPDPAAWEQALAALVEDPAACRRMALAAQTELSDGCLLSCNSARYLSVWERTAKQ